MDASRDKLARSYAMRLEHSSTDNDMKNDIHLNDNRWHIPEYLFYLM